LHDLIDLPSPVDLLVSASELIDAVQPAYAAHGRPSRSDPELALRGLIDDLEHDPAREAAALLVVLTELAPTTRLRELARVVHTGRTHRPRDEDDLPTWTSRLGEMTVKRCVALEDPLRSDTSLLVEVAIPSAEPFTLGMIVDHAVGTVVVEGIARREAISELVATVAAAAPAGSTSESIAPQDLRALAEQAIANGAAMSQPVEATLWPGARALWSWVLRQLPKGGALRTRRTWTAEDQRELVDAFVASGHARHLATAEHAAIAHVIVTYLSTRARGEPLRPSGPDLTLFLGDWLPGSSNLDPPVMLQFPHVLRAYVEWAHERSGIARGWTAGTLGTLDDADLVLRRLVTLPRTGSSPMVDWHRTPTTPKEDRAQVQTYLELEMLDSLRRIVGGEVALQQLDAEPLSDEDFDWTGVAHDDRAYVVGVLDLLDPIFMSEPDDLLTGTDFDGSHELRIEHRTATRRLLARLARRPRSEWVRPSASPASDAAALAWLVWRVNDGEGLRLVQAKAIATATGLRRLPYDKAWRLLRVACPDAPDPNELMWREPVFGAADLLVSTRRTEIIKLRDEAQGRS